MLKKRIKKALFFATFQLSARKFAFRRRLSYEKQARHLALHLRHDQ